MTREETIKRLKEAKSTIQPFRYIDEAIDYTIKALEQEPKTGYWINAYPDIEPNPMFMYGICSMCGFEQSISNKLNYCPNCGARMVEPQESKE